MQRPLSWLCLGTLLFVDPLPAQFPGCGMPMAGTPMVAPALPHPGLLGQPTGGANGEPSMPAPCGPAMPPRDPSTEGAQLAGKELTRAIQQVTQLPWFDDLAAARLESAATGKPVLWLQALGDIDGFA